ncbi:general substrate transporter [Halenospora varia]|nr:general substrate transporter [Halenospora varia]
MPQLFSSARAVGVELAAVLPKNAKPWYRQAHLIRLNLCLFSLFLFSSGIGYDALVVNSLIALPQWNRFMNYPAGAWLGFVAASQTLGSLFGYPMVAWFNNKIGRKNSILIGYGFIIVGTAIQAAAHNPTMFIVARVLVGFTSAFYGVSATILIAETAYPTHRGIFTALANTGWWIGSFLAAWITYGTRNYDSDLAWKIPSIGQIIIPVIAFPGFWFAPENPRWLAANNRVEEARECLIKHHAGGDRDSGLAHFELQEIVQSLAWDAEHNSASFLDLFRTKGNRYRSFITISLGFTSQWNGIGIATYYLAPVLITVGITSIKNQTMVAGFLQLWNLIFSLVGSLSVDLLGRRACLLTACVGMLGSFILITGLAGSFATTSSAATGIAVVVFLFVFSGFFDFGITPLLLSYPCEIWPYQLRSFGLSMAVFSAASGSFFNIFVNPIALDAITWKYYIVYCVILVGVIAMIYFYYPEMRGYSLEEIARIFDGDSAAPHVDPIDLKCTEANSDSVKTEQEEVVIK